jgi:hypothetical protein
MMRLCAVVLLLVSFVACGDRPQDARPKATAKDPKFTAVEDRIAKTTPEGKQIIEKAKGMKQEVNGQISGKTLGEMIDDYSQNKGAYNIIPIGWEASLKSSNQRWKLIFNYRLYNNELQAAEWEYDPKADKIYPFDKENAAIFWSAPDAKSQGKKG